MVCNETGELSPHAQSLPLTLTKFLIYCWVSGSSGFSNCENLYCFNSLKLVVVDEKEQKIPDLYNSFFNVGPPKEDIFLTTFYGLYFS